MAEIDNFVEGFKKNFANLPADSLAECQYVYKSVIYAMSMEILERFPEAVTGPPPARARRLKGTVNPPWDPDGTGTGGKGPHGSILICRLTCFVLDLYEIPARGIRRLVKGPKKKRPGN